MCTTLDYPATGRRKNPDFFCIFEPLFSLIGAAKTSQIGQFVRYCDVFWHRNQNHDTKGGAKAAQTVPQKGAQRSSQKTPHYLTKCRACGVFAARIWGGK